MNFQAFFSRKRIFSFDECIRYLCFSVGFQGDNMGQEEIREIKELKFRVSKLELVNHVEPVCVVLKSLCCSVWLGSNRF